MLIYRVENSEGLGPYVNTDLQNTFEDLHEKWAPFAGLRPTPQHDHFSATYNTREERNEIAIRKERWHATLNSSQIIYGFQSKELLDAWFIKEMREFLTDKGYGISTYQIDPEHTILYQQQCCFLKPMANKLSHEPFEGVTT